jgi:hypothetical protein
MTRTQLSCPVLIPWHVLVGGRIRNILRLAVHQHQSRRRGLTSRLLRRRLGGQLSVASRNVDCTRFIISKHINNELITVLFSGSQAEKQFGQVVVRWAHSHAADRVEEWLSTQTFTLLSAPGVPTHQGENSGRDSTLDLVWHNLASEAQSTFHGAHIDWMGSLGSDHALIRTFAILQTRLLRQREDKTNQFDTDIDPEVWEEWHAILEIELPHPHTPLTRPADLDAVVDRIYTAFNNACAATMKQKGTAPGFNTCWWNDECKSAAHAHQDAEDPDDITCLNMELKTVTRRAKREWADEYITSANIWEVTAWRHGHRSSHIAALCTHEGDLTFDHGDMAEILSRRFFAEDRGAIPEHFNDDRTPQNARPSHRSMRRSYTLSSRQPLTNRLRVVRELVGT